jgi:hypothetical protein
MDEVGERFRSDELYDEDMAELQYRQRREVMERQQAAVNQGRTETDAVNIEASATVQAMLGENQERTGEEEKRADDEGSVRNDASDHTNHEEGQREDEDRKQAANEGNVERETSITNQVINSALTDEHANTIEQQENFEVKPESKEAKTAHQVTGSARPAEANQLKVEGGGNGETIVKLKGLKIEVIKKTPEAIKKRPAAQLMGPPGTPPMETRKPPPEIEAATDEEEEVQYNGTIIDMFEDESEADDRANQEEEKAVAITSEPQESSSDEDQAACDICGSSGGQLYKCTGIPGRACMMKKKGHMECYGDDIDPLRCPHCVKRLKINEECQLEESEDKSEDSEYSDVSEQSAFSTPGKLKQRRTSRNVSTEKKAKPAASRKLPVENPTTIPLKAPTPVTETSSTTKKKKEAKPNLIDGYCVKKEPSSETKAPQTANKMEKVENGSNKSTVGNPLDEQSESNSSFAIGTQKHRDGTAAKGRRILMSRRPTAGNIKPVKLLPPTKSNWEAGSTPVAGHTRSARKPTED